MIVTEDFGKIKQVSFSDITINTELRTITIFFLEEDGEPLENRIINGTEIYTGIKKMWVDNADKLLQHPFPMEYVDRENVKLINGWQVIIK